MFFGSCRDFPEIEEIIAKMKYNKLCSDEEYWIYVEPISGGPKREFMVGIHYYHALNPGDKGTMTYRGQQFIHFALQRD